MNDPKIPKKEIKIELPEDIAQGVYSNFAIISHTETEFIFDFAFIHPSQPKNKVRSRIITSPAHAKRFLKALEENIARYEQKAGKIKDLPEPPKGFGIPLSQN